MTGTIKNVSLTIFGGTGDLTKRKLLPALYNLYAAGILKDCFEVVCIGRRPYSQEDYIDFVDSWVKEHARIQIEEEILKKFYSHITYYKMDFTDLNEYEDLNTYFKQHPCSNHMMYYAVAPAFFDVITQGVMTLNNVKQPKIILEKPFGETLEQAKELNKTLEESFGNDHIYRIDHYLGKEMVRNILTIRETNPIFENAWSNQFVDHIEIDAFEEVGVGTRANYYDHAGALKDMVQNHLLQILSVVAVDDLRKPLRKEQIKILNSLEPVSKETIKDCLVLGQYKGYKDETNVAEDSTTETYAGLKIYLDHPRWKGVPFYVQTGKKCSKREIEVKVVFKSNDVNTPKDVLVVKIQPTEGVYLEFNIKTPGEDSITRARMDFCQNCNLVFKLNTPEAYERMLFACMNGDSRWFTSFEQIEASWKYVEDLKRLYQEAQLPLYEYAVGSDGPIEFEELKK